MSAQTVGERILQVRRRLHMTQGELAEKAGYHSRSTIAKIESGERLPSRAMAKKLARVLNISPVELFGFDENTYPDGSKPRMLRRVPLLGSIACGLPREAIEEYDQTVTCPDGVDADFCLRAKGESMTGAGIFDGDIVFIREQPEVEDGEIAAVIVDNEATLKRIFHDPSKKRLQLLAENPAYPPMVYVGKELIDVRILGKAIAVLRVI